MAVAASRWIGTAVLVACLSLASGCIKKQHMGPSVNAGIGALTGKLAGKKSPDTLTGAGVGKGFGFLIGDEKDRGEAKGRTAVREEELRPLSGTIWEVVRTTPPPKEPFESFRAQFKPDGTVVSKLTIDGSRIMVTTERYRIVGPTLILNQDNYVVNAKFQVEGDTLSLVTGRCTVVLRRVPP